mgnify:CR=1 FL=1
MVGYRKIDFFPYDLVSLGTIGDGNCFYHAILQGFNKSYRKGDITEKRKLTIRLKLLLASVLDEKNPETGETFYNELGNGEISKLSESILKSEENDPNCKDMILTKENMQRKLISNEWGDYTVLELVSNQLDIDIYVLSEAQKDVYLCGDKENLLKGRKSVIIIHRTNHFETVGLKVQNNIITFFDKDNDIIKFLRSRYR